MRMKVALAAAALALLGATSARADLLLTLTSPVDLGGGQFQYGGQVHNNGDEVLLNGPNISLPAGVGYADTIGDLKFGDLPLTLTKGGDFTTNEFFVLTVPAGFKGEGIYSLSGEDANGGPIATNDAPFRIIGASDVPEPGSLALLTGMLVSGGLFMVRRRK